MQETLQNLVQQFKQSIAASESTELNLLEEPRRRVSKFQPDHAEPQAVRRDRVRFRTRARPDQQRASALDEINMIGDVGSRIRRVQSATPPDIKSFPKIIPVVVGVMFLFTGCRWFHRREGSANSEYAPATFR